MNNDFLIADNKKRIFNNKLRKIEYDSINRENALFYGRMSLVKSNFDPKKWDREYQTDHQKMIKKIKKVHIGDVLPTINQRDVIASLNCKTEASQNMSKDKSMVKETKTQPNEEEKPEENKEEEL